MAQSLSTKHVVIICTKNRQQSLERLVDSIQKCLCANQVKVVVVDSTEDEELISRNSKMLKMNFAMGSNSFFYPKGLPSCRNKAIEILLSAENSLFHFFDDDLQILDSNYFIAIDDFFSHNPQCIGGGPRIAGLYIDDNSKSRILEHFGLTFSSNEGRVTRTGNNFWIPDKPQKSIRVDWIPGCSMIFRSELFKIFRFDETLEMGPGKNYALGEDKEFGWRVSRNFELRSIPEVRVYHHLESSKRDHRWLMFRARAFELGYFSKAAGGHITLPRILFGEFIRQSYFLGSAVKGELRTLIKSLLSIIHSLYSYLTHLIKSLLSIIHSLYSYLTHLIKSLLSIIRLVIKFGFTTSKTISRIFLVIFGQPVFYLYLFRGRWKYIRDRNL